MKIKNNGLRFLRILTLALALTFAIALFTMGDVEAKHWANDEINEWKNQGLLKNTNGDTLPTFRPDEKCTRAEFMAFINNMNDYTRTSDDVKKYKDVKANDWFYNTVAVALEAGYINGTGADTMDPNGNITREQAMTILTRISDAKTNKSAYVNAKDATTISAWAREGVSTCINEGFIAGYKGKINPLANITRAEAVVMLNRYLTDTRTFAIPGTYDLNDEKIGDMIVLTKDINFKNIRVKNSVLINKDIDGTVTFDKVDIDKDLNVNSGKLLFYDSNVYGKLELSNASLLVDKNASVYDVILKAGATLESELAEDDIIRDIKIDSSAKNKNVELKGDFNKVENEAEDVALKINGKIEELKTYEDMALKGRGSIDEIDRSRNVKIEVLDSRGHSEELDRYVDKISIDDDGLANKDRKNRRDRDELDYSSRDARDFERDFKYILEKDILKIDIDDQDDIEDARKAYDSLPSRERRRVDDDLYEKLEALEERLEALLDSESEKDRKNAKDFKEEYKDVLKLTVFSVDKDDKDRIERAIYKYENYPKSTRKLLELQKWHLDNLLKKLENKRDNRDNDRYSREARGYLDDYEDVLDLTKRNVRASDRRDVEKAIKAYEDLSIEARRELDREREHLKDLIVEISKEDKDYDEEIRKFRRDYRNILELREREVRRYDEDDIREALREFNRMSDEAQRKNFEDKEHLYNLLDAVNEL